MTSQSILAYISERPHTAEQLMWLDEQGALVGDFMDCHITSHFQPIWRLDDTALIGREAFVRTHAIGGRGVSVWELFDQAEDDDGVVYLDRLCRTLHAMNFFLRKGFSELLFLNVHERLLHRVPEEHGQTFAKVLHSLGIRASRVVIELPERLSHSRSLLRTLTQNYQRNGFQVALNVHELGEARELALLTGADIIKVPVPHDAGSVLSLGKDVQALRDTGKPLVFTRIAYRDQFEQLRAAGAQYGQGYWLDEWQGGLRVAV